MAKKELVISTISSSLNEYIKDEIAKVRIFNLSEGAIDISLSGGMNSRRKLMGTFEATWIRIYDVHGKYYDFITSTLFFISNEKGVLLLCSEETEFIDMDYIANLILDYVSGSDDIKFTSHQYIHRYYGQVSKDIKKASKKLQELYSISSQMNSSRFDVEGSLEQGKLALSKTYLLNLITRAIIKENKDKIIEIIS